MKGRRRHREGRASLHQTQQAERASSREQEVVAHLARGYTFPQIAEKLFVTLDTVQSHAKSIYRKMGIHKKQELVEAIEESRSKLR